MLLYCVIAKVGLFFFSFRVETYFEKLTMINNIISKNISKE